MRNYILIASVLLASCQNNSDSRVSGISGSLENGSGKTIELNQIKNNSAELLESVTVADDGTFRFSVIPGPFDFYTITIEDQQVVLLTDSSESVTVTGNTEDLLGSYDIEGSEHSKVLRDYYTGTLEFRNQLDSIQKAFQTVAQTANEEQKQQMIDAFDRIRGDYQKYQVAYVTDHASSPACISILGEMNPEENLDLFKKVHSEIAPVFSGHVYYGMLGNQIAEAERKTAAMAKLKPGSIAPDIELPNPEGKNVALSSLRGKVVLIDFWASWCKPCRVENPNVVKMYNEYRGQGFEIFGVSLDRDKDKWVQAIKQDGLTWPQVSDLQFWNSAAAQLYNVSSIPHTVLIDREGKIIANGLRGRALEEKVKESVSS
jgi:peroxiredoxin